MADSSTRVWPLEDTELAPALRLITTLARADMGVLMLLDDAAQADEMFSILMGEDVEQRRVFIQRNAKDVRFLDI